MTAIATPRLTSGPLDSTFEEALTSVQNYGFLQAVFEVERLETRGTGKSAKTTAGKVTVLRPSSAQAKYPLIKPGDRVLCPGLAGDATEEATFYRVRRMAEGLGRRHMTVWE